ncbi:capsule biosynthesis protein [Parasulfitobacter algicola]|uniref:Capsular biosynthesis protein n=1 Tax=Parasulfitobacter algicola TaxID=2614809 RepID=A0ABX2IT85_9RHOB|nr:capsular biosynthesis protein [Sulfitobacter algicola]NSX54022.1 capsular biosynthesis protein [Sulfitobacter algicola]
MAYVTGKGRNFLLLQGPHGPFFNRLGHMLTLAGADVWRVGFNTGDHFFWSDKARYIPFYGRAEDWPGTLKRLLNEKSVTDIVIYADTRPLHAQAVKIAKENDINVHVFEEGYLRPYWISYEREGSNGNSKLMNMSVSDMRAIMAKNDLDVPLAPDHWGALRQHMFYGALYHWFVMFRNGNYRNFKPHRSISVGKEFRLHLSRLMLLPLHAIERMLATYRVKQGGYPYHIALLQLEHDASFQDHSPFSNISEFLRLVMEGFAKGAPTHHHLVFKAHPLEDGRAPVRSEIRRLAKKYGVEDRTHYIRGGKLARLLDHARSAVTVNSTAAQQVLWRGLPLKAFGTAIYGKPEFVSTQPLADFFSMPSKPDNAAYRDFRRYLLETSQLPGSFYSTKGRRQLLRQVVDMMLMPMDPYDALKAGTPAPRQQLSVVNSVR